MTGQQIFETALALFDEPIRGKFSKPEYAETIKLILNQGYREVCTRGHCARGTGTIVTAMGQKEYDFLSDCGAVKSIKRDGSPLLIIREDDVENDITAAPVSYYLAIDKIGFAPIPDGTYILDMVYYKKPTQSLPINDEQPSLVPAEWHHVLAYFMVKEFFKIDKGDRSQGYIKWDSIYEQELAKMKHYLNEGINADQYIGVR
jgi:hypothetical protein